jgi:hypothetical protein
VVYLKLESYVTDVFQSFKMDFQMVSDNSLKNMCNEVNKARFHKHFERQHLQDMKGCSVFSSSLMLFIFMLEAFYIFILCEELGKSPRCI